MNEDLNSLSEAEVSVLRSLRDRGFAVVIFSPTEVGAADPSCVEDRLIAAGWDVINRLQGI